MRIFNRVAQVAIIVSFQILGASLAWAIIANTIRASSGDHVGSAAIAVLIVGPLSICSAYWTVNGLLTYQDQKNARR